jgi:hypothetical protein
MVPFLAPMCLEALHIPDNNTIHPLDSTGGKSSSDFNPFPRNRPRTSDPGSHYTYFDTW